MQILGKAIVDLQLTEEAKEHFLELLANSTISNPIPGISWGKWNDESEYHWMIVLYDRDNCTGWLCQAPELEFIVIHDRLIEWLQGKVLDVNQRKATIH